MRTAVKGVAGLCWFLVAAAAAGAAGCGESSGGGSEDGSGGPAACSVHDDEQGTEVTLRFRNASDSVIYVNPESHCTSNSPFDLHGDAGAVVPWNPGLCTQICGREFPGCHAECAYDPLVQISPGGHYDMPWDGRVLVDRTDACDENGEPLAATCQQRVIGAGPYEVTGWIYTQIMGCDPAPPEGCACEPTTGEDACRIGYTAIATSARSATQTASYQHGDALIELVFP